MIRELKESYNYKTVMAVLSVLTFVSGLAFSFLGEIFLPFAAAFCASLFLFERSRGRVLSYVIPAVPSIISISVNGIFGIISVEYILLALIIVLVYRYSGTKTEAAVYITLVASAFLLLSLYLGGARAIGSFNLSVVTDHYMKILNTFKAELLNILNTYGELEGDMNSASFSREELDIAFDELLYQLVSLIAVLAFLISGIAIKLFSFIALRVGKNGILKSFAHFIPTNITSYAFIGVLIISIFSGTATQFGIVMLNVCNVLTAVFAYMGIRYAMTFAAMSGRRGFIYALTVGALLIAPSGAVRLLSIVGVWATVGTNNAMRDISSND